ncbi:MAG: transporter substrate-binding domain-containing protein [Syntrophobacteraceae bacterium]
MSFRKAAAMMRHGLGRWSLGGAGIIVLIVLFTCPVGSTPWDGSTRAFVEKAPAPLDGEGAPEPFQLTPEEKAWLEEHPSLRLGVDPAWPPYEFVDSVGRYSGIAADYVALIRARLGIAMEIQPDLTWEQVLSRLESKELDISPAITRTPERSRFLLFTQPHIKYSVAIVTRVEQTGVEDLASLAGRKVALVKGYAFTEIALASQPDILPLYVDTVLEGLNKVTNGETDAIVSDLPSLSYKISEYNFLNLKVAGIAPFQTEGLRIGVRNDWPILSSILEKALASITPEEHQQIRRRWISVRDTEHFPLVLTPEEREWLANHPVIRNAADPAWAPIEFIDAQGRLRGITSEYLGHLERMLHVRFETPRETSWAQMMDALREGGLDMASCVRNTPQRQSFLEFTEPYFSMSTAIFARTDVSYVDLASLKGKRVAVVEGYALQDLISGEYPEIELVPVENIEKGLRLLSRGEVHAYVDALAPGTYGLNHYGFNNIHVAGETPFRYEMSMAASKQQPILASILQKSLKALPEEDRERFFQKWVNVPIAYKPDYSIIWKTLAGAAVLLLVFVYWNRRLSREVSGRRQVEAALRLAKDELELRVEQRTAELEARNVALADEVAERRRAEDAHRESERRFIQLFDSAPVPMAFASDADGYRGTTWNEAWYRTFGYPREVAEGRSGNDIGLWVNPDDRSRFVETAKKLNDVTGFETLLRRHDGAVLNCSLFGRFIGMTGHRLLMAVYLDITERKQAEAALRESEERFFKAFSLSPAPMVISEIETGRFIDVNEQWLRMMEYSREETIDHTSYEQEIWEDPEVRMRLGKRLKETGSFRDEPVRFISKSGKIRDCLWSAEKVNLGGSEVMLSLIFDFTERKRAEDALRAKTEEVDRFFSLTLDLLCIADIEGHFRRLNPQWEAVLGYSIEELEGRRFLDLVHPEDLDATRAAMGHLAAQESVLDFTNRYRCRDGSYRWIEWRSIPAGNLVYAAARDITERKKTEEALRESEDLLRKSQSVARIGSYCLDVRTGTWTSSLSLDEIFGINEHHPRNVQGWIALVHPEDKQAMLDHLQDHVLTECNRFEKEYRIVRSNDGQERWVFGLGELELDFAGNPVRMIGTIQDITERKRAGDELRASLEEKESLLKEVHHRVKNNLQVISSLLQLRARKVRSPEVLEFLRDTQNRVRSMALLHETLYRSGNLAKVNLPQYVKNVCTHVARSYTSEARTVRLRHEITDVSLDLDLAIPVGLIINELVSNAFKHAFRAGPGGEILVELRDVPEGELVLRVSDNGVGMPPEMDPQSTETLGLLLVRNLARQLDGRMAVASEQGTVFEIEFPATVS